MAKEASKSNANVMAAAAYFLGIITGIIVYLMEKDNKYVRFHAMQSILLTVVVFVINIVLGMLFMGMAFAGGGAGANVFMMIFWVWYLVIFLLWLFMMWKAYSGEKFKLPILGDLAEKNA